MLLMLMLYQNSIMDKITVTEMISNRSLHEHNSNPNPMYDTILRETCSFSSLLTLLWWYLVCAQVCLHRSYAGNLVFVLSYNTGVHYLETFLFW